MAQPSGIFTAPQFAAISSPPVTNLTGSLVSLGPLRREWLPIYQHWLNDFEMLKLVDRHFKPHSTEWIANWYDRHATGHTDSLIFTVIENGSSRPVGNIALQDLDYRNRTAELGIFIGDIGSRGQGYGTEATSLIVNFAFRVLGLQNIMLRVYEYNEPAIRVYQRTGFTEFGRRHRGQFMDGRFWDVILMECLPPTVRQQLSI